MTAEVYLVFCYYVFIRYYKEYKGKIKINFKMLLIPLVYAILILTELLMYNNQKYSNLDFIPLKVKICLL